MVRADPAKSLNLLAASVQAKFIYALDQAGDGGERSRYIEMMPELLVELIIYMIGKLFIQLIIVACYIVYTARILYVETFIT